MTRPGLTLAAALIAALPFASHAFTIDPFGPHSSGRGLTHDDMTLIRSQMRGLLEQGRIGEAKAWTNTVSGNSGTLRLTAKFSEQGLRCRRLTHTIRYRRAQDPRRFEMPYCKHGSVWKTALR